MTRAVLPFAFAQFAADHPDQARPRPRTAARLAFDDLSAVNRAVNAAITYAPDPGRDRWCLPGETGDCEDFALEKQRRLFALGWGSADARLALGKTPAGEGHAVLIARGLVLDNRHDQIVPPAGADLAWLKIQTAADPMIWERYAG